MIRLAQVNSRLKDFYDIYILTENFDFDGRTIYEAVYETFQRRGTPYEREPVVFSDEFVSLPNKEKQWAAFLKRSVKASIPFSVALERIREFLLPVYEHMLNEQEYFAFWSKQDKVWLRTGDQDIEND